MALSIRPFVPQIAAVSTNATLNTYAQQCNAIALANARRSDNYRGSP